MNDPISLDQSDDPSMAQPAMPGPGQDEPEPNYPEVSLSNPSLINLPNTGKSVIEHEVVSRTHEKDHKGNPHHRVRIKIKSIRPMGRRKTNGNSHLAAESAMRDMMEEHESQ